MNGTSIIGTIPDITLVLTILAATRLRSLFAVVIVIGLGIQLVYALEGLKPEIREQAILGQLFAGILLHRIFALLRRHPFLDDAHGIMPYLYRRLPFDMPNWVWHSRIKNLLNTVTRWFDRISIAIVLGILCYVVISRQLGYLDVIPGYAAVWLVYLWFIIPVIGVEAISRFIFTLTRKGNLALLGKWVANGFRRSRVITESQYYTHSKTWFLDGFKSVPQDTQKKL